MLRVPVLSISGQQLMPTKASRARRWLKEGIAKVVHNDLGIFQVQLVEGKKIVPIDGYKFQPIVVGIDPGKLYTGIGVQSAKFTLWLAHLQLPFKAVRERMAQRSMMRRNRRGRRINKAALRGKLPPQTCRRKLPFEQRAHRLKRFNNRRSPKIPPSIRANRELELRILYELSQIYPITAVIYEVVKAKGDKGFSPVMVGQRWQLENLRNDFDKVFEVEGWKTAQIRTQLGLEKQKHFFGDAIPATHAVDGIALACSQFIKYDVIDRNTMGWSGKVQVTPAPFAVIRRPPISRRQLHLMLPSKGGTRRKYGGTVTRHGFRKGDYVEATQGKRTVRGWVSGDTKTQVSVSNSSWERYGQFSVKKVRLLQRSTGLIVTGAKAPVSFSSHAPVDVGFQTYRESL